MGSRLRESPGSNTGSMEGTYMKRFVPVIIGILLLAALPACSDDEAEPTTVTPQSGQETIGSSKAAEITITIGVITDKTGMAALSMQPVDLALEDLIRYFNEKGLAGGARLEAIFYDGQYDPSKDLPGYQWLRERGADVIFANLPNTPVTLKPHADRDHVPVFAIFASRQAIDPPGWVFCMNVPISAYAYTMLEWVAENDWDWRVKGPARVGGTGWTGPLWAEILQGAEDYCKSHPDRFTWEGGYLTEFAMTWPSQVEALKDCDYVIPPGAGLLTFAREFRGVGADAKFLCFESQATTLGATVQAVGWEAMDGSLFAFPNRWWNEDAELSNLANELLIGNHPNSAAEIRQSGSSYLGGITEWYGVLMIIAESVKAVGAENFDSEALYRTASSFSMTFGGCAEWDFSETKRTSWNYVGIYELRAAQKDLIRKDPAWHPIVYSAE